MRYKDPCADRVILPDNEEFGQVKGVDTKFRATTKQICDQIATK